MGAASGSTSEGGSGILYLVATPIGNLADITLRAIETLKGVDRIVAEDTRHSKRLLQHYAIETPLGSSLYQGVERDRTARLIEELQQGRDLALISDAGTPLISDPGYRLVRAAVEAGIRVVPIPGPTAFVAGLVASGFPTDQFLFLGVPPKKSGQRQRFFERLVSETRTVVLYESRHRLVATLETMDELLPDRQIAVCRELTKLHEEIQRGTPSELLTRLGEGASVKGEFVLVLAGAE